MLKFDNIILRLFLFWLLSNVAITSLFSQCNIPIALLDIGEPQTALIQRFERYERDSLRFEKDEECILNFYNEFIYCLRRTENNKRALEMVDSVLMGIDKNAFVLQKTSLEVEKAVLLFLLKRDMQFYQLVDTIEANLIQHNFFEAHHNRKEVQSLISVSMGLFSDAERSDFVNLLLMKELELNTDQDSFYYFHHWFMIGLNNLNNYSYHKANEDFEMAFKYSNSEGVDSAVLAELVVLKGTALIELDSFQDAIHFFKRAFILNNNNSPLVNAYAFIGLANAYNDLSMQDSLSLIYENLESISNNEEMPDFIKRDVLYFMAIENLNARNLTSLSANNQKLKGLLDTITLHDKYLFYQMKQYVAVLKKFNNNEVTAYLKSRQFAEERKNNKEIKVMNRLNVKYQTEKKEAENIILLKEQKLQTAKLKSQKQKLYGTLIVASLLAAILLLLIKQNKDKKKNIRTLFEKNNKIQTLHSDLSHRIKNNLSMFSGLMQMQSAQLNHPEAKEAVLENESRIATLSLLHQRLSPVEDNRKIQLSSYIKDLCGNVEHLFYRPDSTPKINVSVDDLTIDTEKAVYLALILNELMTNSFKYAFQNQANPKIDISVEQINEQGLRMTYIDNGIGLPDNINPESVTSLGLKLIHTLTRQLKGVVNMKNENGACFQFNFKEI